MFIDDEIRLDQIFDYKNGRRFQVIAVSKDKKNPLFTVHNDMLGRPYIKLKLNEQNIMKLIQELQKGITANPAQVVQINKNSRKPDLRIVPSDSDNNNGE